MLILNKPRGSGKTTEAIELALEKNYTIVSATKERARNVLRIADALGKGLPSVICFADFIDPYIHYRYRSRCNGYIIDDADDILMRFCNNRGVKMVTSSVDGLGLPKEISRWREK